MQRRLMLVPSVKGKGKGLVVDSRENEEQAIEGMETEEEGEKGGLFSKPKRGNSPQQQGKSQATDFCFASKKPQKRLSFLSIQS